MSNMSANCSPYQSDQQRRTALAATVGGDRGEPDTCGTTDRCTRQRVCIIPVIDAYFANDVAPKVDFARIRYPAALYGTADQLVVRRPHEHAGVVVTGDDFDLPSRRHVFDHLPITSRGLCLRKARTKSRGQN